MTAAADAERTAPAVLRARELYLSGDASNFFVSDDSELPARVSAPNGGRHDARGGMVLVLLDVDSDHDHVRIARGDYDSGPMPAETLQEAIRVAQQALEALERVACA